MYAIEYWVRENMNFHSEHLIYKSLALRIPVILCNYMNAFLTPDSYMRDLHFWYQRPRFEGFPACGRAIHFSITFTAAAFSLAV